MEFRFFLTEIEYFTNDESFCTIETRKPLTVRRQLAQGISIKIGRIRFLHQTIFYSKFS